MKKFLLIGFTFLLMLFTSLQGESAAFSVPDTNKSLWDKGKIEVKLAEARHEFLANNITGAINICREILSVDKGNARAKYRLGYCYYRLQQYEKALDYANDANNAGNDRLTHKVYLLLGKTYHRMERLDAAIDNYKEYRREVKKKKIGSKQELKYSDVKKFIEQCKYAKDMMKDPVDVEVNNMGTNVNTKYDEYTPCISADKKTMVFTARRPDTKGGGKDLKGDHKYFEDVYFSEWDEEKSQWGESENLPGRVNTVGYDAVLSISPNGESIFLYRNNPEMAGDILIAKKSTRTGKWRRPEPLPKPINTSYYEGSITTTASGNEVFFISERKGGNGRGDIYFSKKIGRDEWKEPENLGPVVNTPYDEKFVYVHPDGKTLFFASNGHQTMGSYDIFKTENIDGEWTEPVNLGYPINGVNEESTFSLTSDYNTLYIAGYYDNNLGARDLYEVDLSKFDVLAHGSEKNTHGKVTGQISNENGDPVQCEVKFFDLQDRQLVGLTSTDSKGEYSIRLRGGKDYKIVVEAESFKKSEEKFTLQMPESSKEQEPMEMNLSLEEGSGRY